MRPPVDSRAERAEASLLVGLGAIPVDDPAPPATAPASGVPSASASASIARKRRSNLRLARRSAAPTSTLRVARQVGADEQHVADLVLEAVARGGVAGSASSAANSTRTSSISSCSLSITGVDVRPVEADARGALLQLHRALPFRQAARDAGQRGTCPRAPLASRSRRLLFFPRDGLRLGVVDRAHRRTRADGGAPSCRRSPRPRRRSANAPCSSRHARMEHHLQQQVAEFVLQVGQVAAVDRVGDFVGLLDRVRRDASRSPARRPTGSRPAGRAGAP